MARLLTAGAEIGLETNDVRLGPDGDVEGANVPTIDRTFCRSGHGSWYFDSTGSNSDSYCGWQTPGAGAATNRWYYLRGYFYFPSVAPSTEFNLMAATLSGTTVVALRMKTDGSLTLSRRVNTAANIGSGSRVLKTNRWYEIAMSWYVSSSGSTSQCAMLIDGYLEDYVSGQNFNNSALDRFELGITSVAGASFHFWMDDIALNDDSGDYENNWPEPERVVALVPRDVIQNGSWTGGSGGTSNLYIPVSNLYNPNGKADANKDNTTQITSVDTSGDNSTDEFTVHLQSLGEVGVSADHLINVVQPLIYHGERLATGTKTGSFGAGGAGMSWSSYTTFTFGNDSGAVFGWDGNWYPAYMPPLYRPRYVEVGTRPWMAIRKTDAGSGNADCCFMGMLVGYRGPYDG